ncbi:5-methyltetrahydropteroyltriglutamate--homocysteine S-methyltransferase [Cellulomonas triticagri]|uniref:5-methyltetrahydropteroyltriglutamate--homocysteine S-methyltransferase n=1 Tax=Cellulomonas triticagri TaxID=2483352 RepID=A0A3M2JLD6_9CELL|nr:5-methyltetrahydropteroyltriglutamate--homocysteine S-methyltransferase [Cellulomonas triticagri]RMI14409.1 5-methyltetrahydropteroyltriglutamate--homocysteine S-methyltransferase [Cellulomonas triticagri]
MTHQTHPFPSGTVLGYPRIGPRRELKKALEAFWAGRAEAAEVEATAADLRRRTRTRLAELGLATDLPAIPSAFSFYDQVLDAATVLGAVPDRFADLVDGSGALDLAGYSTVARGRGDDLPLEMTKWFDSNYHYLVPEIGPGTTFRFASDRPVREFAEGLADGVLTRPVLVGPVTFLALAKAAEGSPEGFAPIDRLADVLPVYAEVLRALRAAGATWVQLEEPALVSDSTGVPADRLLAAATEAYRVLATDLPAAERPSILVAAPYGDLRDALPVLAATDVEGLALDLVRGTVPTGSVAGLADKVVVGGVVDGHNIWRADLDAALGGLERLEGLGAHQVAVGTSTSLFHVPHDVEDEPQLDPTLRSWLAFADQKVREVVTLATGVTEGREAVHAELLAAADARRSRAEAPGVVRPEVRERLGGLDATAFRRGEFATRQAAQAERLGLPALPTTTIGSFPQTPEIRVARAAFGRGEISAEQYQDEMRAEVRRVVELQEQIGLDVLVHGEPERNDMVQYFAENLDGFSVTQNGWVQSYGSRCTRPSILWGDVSRPAPITVPWTTYAQSLTPKPVKGMLTGPVTILAWSFVRDDQPLADTANQVALALRDEIADLEAAGTAIVQVDEPALRELLPLRADAHAAYLDWSVASFRLSTSGVRPDTQIHTHLCYSEFGEIFGAIDGLDADVTSIEAARSKMEILGDIAAEGYPRGIGPGVWDIHSPRVPSEAEVTDLLASAVRVVDPTQLWVNPDCGLKTRRYEEVTPSLEHVLAATRTVRDSLAIPTA